MKQPLFSTIVALTLYLALQTTRSAAQENQFTLSQAISTGLTNYQSIQAKRNYLNASKASVQNVKNQYLPDILASIQQAYGTANGQYGPIGPFAGGAGISSSGPVYLTQSWDAGFGGIYLINTNWEFISFGRFHSRVVAADKQVSLDSANLTQEKFIQSVKIAGAYLTLLITQRFVQNAQSNVERAGFVQQTVIARTKSGLNAGVDSSIANAELSAAKLVLIQAINNEQQTRNQLCQLINIEPLVLHLDTSFFSLTPTTYQTRFPVTDNPQARYFESRIEQSHSTEDLLRKSIYPGLSLLGTFQAKGSGFDTDYTPLNDASYSKNYFDGINPSRYNYVFGLGIAWNLISPIKIKQQVKAQQFITAAYQNEYDLISTQLKDQLLFSDQQIENSISSIKEVPVEYKAASDAYLQKTVLYKNGLTNIVDVQQALYSLNRAETDMSVAYINVWQALLLKAAASGDFDLFIKQVK
jgi:outer membrane protein TolC